MFDRIHEFGARMCDMVKVGEVLSMRSYHFEDQMILICVSWSATWRIVRFVTPGNSYAEDMP